MSEYSLYKKKKISEKFVKVKQHGKIYTPDYLVDIILDRAHYCDNIVKKHIIDNSCGDGQFMVRIVDRYCRDFLKKNNNIDILKRELETYIHAIEIDRQDLTLCEERCNKIVEAYGLFGVKWDFVNQNALKVNKYNGKMDFVVGNPPYVRVHNLNDDRELVKNSLFCKNGMTDLYIVFYEIGIRMLNCRGVLAYITPSSYFTSLAGREMRKYFLENRLLESVCDLRHFQAFNATTYTAITCLSKNIKSGKIEYSEFDKEKFIPKHVANLDYEEFNINGEFFFSTSSLLADFRKIMYNTNKADFRVKNGYATLADKVFVHNFDFKSEFIIPVIKASRGKWYKVFFPYNNKGELVDEAVLMKDAKIKEYLLSNKDVLLDRSNDKDSEKYWYAFGRSQGINDTNKDKLSLNTLIKDSAGVKVEDVPAGCGVYSGLYIISDTIPYAKIKSALKNENFFKYVSLLGKYKSGGYYTFSSKDVTNYLNFKLFEGSERC